MNSFDRIHAVLLEIDSDLREQLQDEAFLIGSAAACLAGGEVEVLDLDLLTSENDAIRLEQAWAPRRVTDYSPADGQLFRSRFARYAFAAMAVEVMGDLQVHAHGTWQSLKIGHGVPLPGYASGLSLPSVSEQLRVLGLFGRAKDRRRAESLRSVQGGI